MIPTIDLWKSGLVPFVVFAYRVNWLTVKRWKKLEREVTTVRIQSTLNFEAWLSSYPLVNFYLFFYHHCFSKTNGENWLQRTSPPISITELFQGLPPQTSSLLETTFAGVCESLASSTLSWSKGIEPWSPLPLGGTLLAFDEDEDSFKLVEARAWAVSLSFQIFRLRIFETSGLISAWVSSGKRR